MTRLGNNAKFKIKVIGPEIFIKPERSGRSYLLMTVNADGSYTEGPGLGNLARGAFDTDVDTMLSWIPQGVNGHGEAWHAAQKAAGEVDNG
jgi:hypothetical protein